MQFRKDSRSALWYMAVATLLFAGMDVCVKLASRLPTLQIVFFRALVAVIICVAVIKARKIPMWGTDKRRLITRGVCGTAALILYFYSIKTMPLASAVTIQKLSPIFTVIIGRFFGRERISRAQFGLFGIAFLGALLINGFDLRVTPLSALAAFGGAVFSACAYNSISQMRDTENPWVIIFYFPLITLPVCAGPAFAGWVAPEPMEWLYLIMVGIFVQLAQLFMTIAYQFGEMSSVSMVSNLNIILAAAVSLLFFGETLGWPLACGMTLIIFSVATFSRRKG